MMRDTSPGLVSCAGFASTCLLWFNGDSRATSQMSVQTVAFIKNFAIEHGFSGKWKRRHDVRRSHARKVCTSLCYHFPLAATHYGCSGEASTKQRERDGLWDSIREYADVPCPGCEWPTLASEE